MTGRRLSGRRVDHRHTARPPDADRFRHLPEPVRPEDLVETVDVSRRPVRDEESEQRERMLREAGGI